MTDDHPSLPPALSYEQARDMAANADPSVRRDLGGRSDAPPEVLYFLASDDEVEVRRAVAANPATPALGDLILCDDGTSAVRRTLAGKLEQFGRFGRFGDDQPRAQTIMDAVTASLAGDSLVDIRLILANLLKDAGDVDPAVISKLAWDEDIRVAAPILESSPLLSDADLLELIGKSTVEGVSAAIARRPLLGETVGAAIVASANVPAIAHLLKNATAALQEETLDALIDGAAAEPSWQEPLVSRPELREDTIERLVQSVAAHVLDHMLERQDLPTETALVVVKEIEERVRQGGQTIPLQPVAADRYLPLIDTAIALQAAGQLDETALTVALLTDHSEDLAAGLAVLAVVPIAAVLDIISARSAAAVCALAWAAGLSASFAVDLQIRLAGIPSDAVLQPAADGCYALSDAELTWQLEMFGAR